LPDEHGNGIGVKIKERIRNKKGIKEEKEKKGTGKTKEKFISTSGQRQESA